MSRRRRHRWVAFAALVGVSVTACGTSTPVDGSTVTVFGPYTGSDADRFAEVIGDFEQSTGIEVAYTGSVNFVSDLSQRAAGNQRPDVAIVPQPGVVDELVQSRTLVALEADAVGTVEAAFDDDALDATPWNLRFAVPYRSNVKSLVWFRPEVFAANDWTVPSTFDDLETLVEQIAESDSMSPWCFSVFAGSATGWPATDWVEDLVLLRAGVDVYDQWARGEYSWQQSEIRGAFEEFRELVIDGNRSAGGLRAILQTEVAEAATPLFAETPGCAMYKQASFAEDWFPSGTSIGPDADVDYFALPSVSSDTIELVTAGDAAVAFDDRPNIHRFMAFLANADGGRAWADDGGFISRRTDVDVDEYYTDVDAMVVQLLQTGATTRFDASDTLPAAVGSDLLWGQITSWINGTLALDDLLVSLDEALEIEP